MAFIRFGDVCRSVLEQAAMSEAMLQTQARPSVSADADILPLSRMKPRAAIMRRISRLR